jgi:hypothetical protein
VVADEAEGTGVPGWAFKKPVDPCPIIEKHPRHLSRENASHPPKMGLKDTQDVVIIPLTPNSSFCIFNLPQSNGLINYHFNFLFSDKERTEWPEPAFLP